ncbi:suppressor of fused protein SUFU [Jejuia pallidilutea]|uniref:Suppressor of fused protein SUFU n=1 Tax=Jejuia pallidilutea TaxID=504487 RepID=A0A362X4H3_9FLAO|nr:suppressor of fused domain protein [Jejuia pallidilutea]PQV44400.1 suppressor of fused protein SUFU [Jejuia pallidilutea]
MNVSEKAENPTELEFAELMMLIPKEIEFDQVFPSENKNDWIISVLKQTAKFPHFYDTWIGIGHTIQAEEDMTPYSDETEFVGALILPSVTFGEDFTEIKKNNRQINIYNVFPLYKNELEYKIENGYNKFLDLLIKANGKEVLDLKRKNLIPNKSIWNKIIGN